VGCLWGAGATWVGASELAGEEKPNVAGRVSGLPGLPGAARALRRALMLGKRENTVLVAGHQARSCYWKS